MGKLVSMFPDLIVGESKIAGKGVFAGRQFNSGDVVEEWKGTLCLKEDLPPGDTALQVAANVFMFSVGDSIGNHYNHSCDPAAAVIIGEGKVLLKAIRPIKPMMEITFDYSITMKNNDFTVKCNCSVPKCRGEVREYKFLPEEVRRRYEYMKIVPAYVMGA